ncbi:hypothetical protein LWC33_18595 [Pseudonocardia sp. RS11V-5]|uniref:hypothetical protein n=1 Tax=Pseudonocardia terrae TaxID=2905831 RepID=UPI001E5AC913|nr:hypothetical protein [Pseudonocardia terrae]MCE3553456.1 hypothetical protein [Pseudonocardia terrae]
MPHAGLERDPLERTAQALLRTLRLPFLARDRLFAERPVGDARLTTFRIDLYGAEDEAWDITVGSLIVSR